MTWINDKFISLATRNTNSLQKHCQVSLNKSDAMKHVNDARKYYNNLPDRHKNMMPNHSTHLDDVALCIGHNNEVFKCLLKCADEMFENVEPRNHDEMMDEPPTNMDMDKLRTVLRQIMRDWSSEGAEERSLCYDPLVQYVLKYLPIQQANTIHKSEGVSILVPGSGLGRLAFELARLGYSCQGNEWSLFMLFASHFILNNCKGVDCLTIYPWVHSWVNNMSTKDQVRPVSFPDTNPAELPRMSNFTMAAGDFLEIYKEPDKWDGVATVYFIDTAHNVISYIERIWTILKPGGCWFNHGPLLYHFSDTRGESSIELSYDEVRSVILQIGFEFEVEKTGMPSTYTQNSTSMLQYMYRCVVFVARKPKSQLP